MKNFPAAISALLFVASCTPTGEPYRGLDPDLYTAVRDTVLADSIVYHPVRVDQNGRILPWASADPGTAYDDVLGRVWHFWRNMEIDANGLPYYMNHQVWDPTHDRRGLGGDQVMMALSSWNLYYDFTGDEAVLANMRFLADEYLARSLSPADAVWPNLPFPYNMDVEGGSYDGDMILGAGYLQPDKAGSFGFELVKLHRKTGEDRYLVAAVDIANTLVSKVQAGDSLHSPWPFKVHALTGETGFLIVDQEVWYEGMDRDATNSGLNRLESAYTTNWTGALQLFDGLVALGMDTDGAYRRAFDLTMEWMRTYPSRTQKWGPFFEDVPRWSDTQINAVTYAQFLIEHPALDPAWAVTVRGIFDWVHSELDDDRFAAYGVTTIDEQTAYRQPGNSHSARQAAAELAYWEATGDTTFVRNAVRMLHWATYTVDHDGKNFYPTNAVWLTDGYGDYVRHYLRAMAAAPELAPAGENHLLRTTSVVQSIAYGPRAIRYRTFDAASMDRFRLVARPAAVLAGGSPLPQGPDGWAWSALDRGGILTVTRTNGHSVEVLF